MTYSNLQILPESLYFYSTDNVHITMIVGTDNGRVFLAGRDGCLYELDYQLYYLGKDGTKLISIDSISHDKSVKKIMNMIKNVDRSKFSPIVQMCCVRAFESDRIHLVAVTSSGIRFYYTTRAPTENAPPPTAAPNCLTLFHIRIPPGFLGQINAMSSSMTSTMFHVEQPNNVHMAASCRELIESRFTPTNKDADKLPGPTNDVIFPDAPAVVTQLYSTNKKFAIVSTVGICIVTKLKPCDQLAQLLVKYNVDSEPVRMYFQVLKEQAMTNCLMIMCSKDAAHSQLINLVTRAYNMYKWDHITSLNARNVLIGQTSTPLPGHGQQPLPGRNLSFMNSPNPNQRHLTPSWPTSPLSTSSPLPPPSSSVAGIGGPPQLLSAVPQPASSSSSSSSSSGVMSLNHRSLYLFLARILRPVWSKPIAVSVMHKDMKTVLISSRLNSNQLSIILQKCQDFKGLLKDNPSLLQGPPSTSATPFNHSGGLNAPSLYGATNGHHYGGGIYGGAGGGHNDYQDRLLASTFDQLACSGNRDVCKQLIRALIEFYIEDNASIDVVSARLREYCSYFYSALDQAQTKGSEFIKVAKTVHSVAEKNKLINLALQQYKIVCNSEVTAPTTTTTPATTTSALLQQKQTADLPTMCSRLASATAYTSLVDLVLTAAAKRDPNNLALHFYLHYKPTEDLEGLKYFNIRADCYKSITETLDYLLSLVNSVDNHTLDGNPDSEMENGGLGSKLGSLVSPLFGIGEKKKDASMMNNNGGVVISREEADRQISEMLHTIVKSDDQMCHYALFTWMISNSMQDRLLQLSSPYMETFLKIESTPQQLQPQPQQQQQLSIQQQQFQNSISDLLTRYYIREKKFTQAARILDKMALEPGNHITLKDRLDYMSRAALCLQSSSALPASSSSSGVVGGVGVPQTVGEFMREVQEKVEVILLQMEVMKYIERSADKFDSNEIKMVVMNLNSQLYDVSELYSKFAIPFELSACKLAILHSSGHVEVNLIQSLWKEIIVNEFSQTASRAADVHYSMQTISTALSSVGKLYHKTDHFFPIDFLVQCLEQMSVQNGFDLVDLSFVYKIFLDIGVDVVQLHEAYERVYRQKLSYYLVEVQANMNQGERLIVKLKELQFKIQRLVAIK
ncbi:hypothetical protein HELRODRAFT_190610 [Helobdella robusta]|uniref:Nucleoporin Nup133/Nup155-like N-terminal domain-containing protein n=1 Tax=Helobdella robusta TaxID=6412 RepID=T1FS47_HELRO|nr:hypothetical protein HELRODRAFT_190610 [Helobdella robusta]ESO08796.1 hypothetical protein HELRODRAFT_190610 [Helobdella robusta]